MIGRDGIAALVQALEFQLLDPDGAVVAVLAPLPDGSTRAGHVLMFTVPDGIGLDPDLPGSMGSAVFSTIPGDPPYAAGVQLVGFTTPGVGAPEVLMTSTGGSVEATLQAGRAVLTVRDDGPSGWSARIDADDIAAFGPWTDLSLAANWEPWTSARRPQWRHCARTGSVEFRGTARRINVTAADAATYAVATGAPACHTSAIVPVATDGGPGIVQPDSAGALALAVSAVWAGPAVGGWLDLTALRYCSLPAPL